MLQFHEVFIQVGFNACKLFLRTYDLWVFYDPSPPPTEDIACYFITRCFNILQFKYFSIKLHLSAVPSHYQTPGRHWTLDRECILSATMVLNGYCCTQGLNFPVNPLLITPSLHQSTLGKKRVKLSLKLPQLLIFVLILSDFYLIH